MRTFFLDYGVNANPSAQRTVRLPAPWPAPVFGRARVGGQQEEGGCRRDGFPEAQRERLSGRPVMVEISHAAVRWEGRPSAPRQ
jgi:hypothetical protein